MRKPTMMLIAALIMLPTTAGAQGYHRGGGGHHHHHHHGGHRGPGAWVGPVLGGLALGAIVNGIIAGQPPYAPPPVYYAPPPVYNIVPQYAPLICRMVPVDVLPDGSTVYQQECRE